MLSSSALAFRGLGRARHPLALSAILALALPFTAQAQDQDAGRKSRVIDEIVVTAQKREQALLDVPMSVSALSGELLEQMGAQDLTDISRVTPGLSVVESAPGVQNLQIRGISTTGVSATVGYQLDNVSLTSFALAQPDAVTFDLASVEVLRGPQGTLYGEGSMGGTIKLITRPPEPGLWDAAVQGGYSTTTGGATSWSTDALLNVPVGGFSALRIVSANKRIGGFIDQVGLGIADANFARKNSLRARYSADLSEAVTINALWMRGDNRAGSSHSGNRQYQRNDRADVGVDDLSDLYGLDLDWAMPWFDVQLSHTVFDRDLLFIYDDYENVSQGPIVTGTPVDLAGPFIGPFTIESAPGDIDVSTLIRATELRLSQGGARYNWVAGIYERRKKERFGLLVDIITEGGVTTPEPYQDFDARGTSRQHSAFAQLDWDFMNWLTLTVGARYYTESVTSDVEGAAAYVLSVDNYDEADFSAFTPRIALSLRDLNWLPSVIDQITVYTSIARGFRSGGANLRVSATDDIPPTYEPDILTAYELGAKWVMLGGALVSEIAVFFNDWSDVQAIEVQQGGATAFGYIANVGRTHGLGLEWNFSYLPPIDGLSLNFSGGYIDTEFVTNGVTKIKGDPVDLVPPLTTAVAASYAFNWGPGRPGLARLDFNWADRSVQTNRSDLSSYRSDVTRFMNFKLGFELPQLQFYLTAKNLLNFRGFVDANRSTLQALSRPRTIGIELKMPLGRLN